MKFDEAWAFKECFKGSNNQDLKKSWTWEVWLEASKASWNEAVKRVKGTTTSNVPYSPEKIDNNKLHEEIIAVRADNLDLRRRLYNAILEKGRVEEMLKDRENKKYI